MNKARFILSKEKVKEQYKKLQDLGVKVSYSYKTNKEVGKVLEGLGECKKCEFSIHNVSEIDDFLGENRKKLWFFAQAWTKKDIDEIFSKGVRNFVVDNEIDLDNLLTFLENKEEKINLLLRMKFLEHRLGAERYFTYGMSADKVNKLIMELKDNKKIEKLGIHIHRKSQNASEWNILQDLRESLNEESLQKIGIINVGGGLPIKYRTYTAEVMEYIFEKIKEVKSFFGENIEIYIEPGRFIAGPAVKLETGILQVQDDVIVINTSIYNCALDTIITDIKLLVEGELENENEESNYYKIKGNTPTRDDLFRHKVKLMKNKVKVGEKLVFLNAGAYNYTTDFCGLEKLETVCI